ncbi:hypothetical protein, conserved [Leishmania donovani]|uniref:Secreted protein n=1 Tax=Leishmania donovani TaxID=5661 RepID=E9BA82_LEIDO|nr:hypothetical protein, conserved [Leishmania donovani]CBZ32155.1 hypothetical protein, conserved [Leishmania donovani]
MARRRRLSSWAASLVLPCTAQPLLRDHGPTWCDGTAPLLGVHERIANLAQRCWWRRCLASFPPFRECCASSY